jgi:predicted nucleotide-binding protein (sugar kinase/HSP70/actin superfamily)
LWSKGKEDLENSRDNFVKLPRGLHNNGENRMIYEYEEGKFHVIIDGLPYPIHPEVANMMIELITENTSKEDIIKDLTEGFGELRIHPN